MKTFIKITEIWIPGRDRTRLELGCGLYKGYEAFREVSKAQSFGHGEGLPGRAWAEGRPVVLKEFDSAHFRRGEAARAAGLTTAIALPIFSGEILLAVVNFICGDDEEHAGAIEVWARDLGRDEMALVDGYFGTLERFEWITRRIRFTFGQGLPGGVWAERAPMVIEDLGSSTTFMRARNAAEAGITTALGLPCFHGPESVHVMAFLSAMGTPIARRFEVWVPDDEHGRLVYRDGHCDLGDDLAARYRHLSIAKGAGMLGAVWLTGVPRVAESLGEDDSPSSRAAQQAGLDALFAMPVFDGAVMKAVVVFAF